MTRRTSNGTLEVLCKVCKTTYTLAEYRALPGAKGGTFTEDEEVKLEWHNCPCGGTMTVETVKATGEISCEQV